MLFKLARTKDLLKDISGTIKSSATAKTAYGDPVRTSRKTIIPVAKIAYGFGGGNGTEKSGEKGHKKAGVEEGGGGGVMVRPVGVIEVTDRKTRYIPIGFKRRLLWFLAAGFFTGWAYSRRHHAAHGHR
ncbi:MAG TPA: hypothetical protein DDW94_04270 [Deltaproteobacteria bacterium]|nr:MAG: hypothetical protein A2Z79_10510 [Deltaproteobacteria bacterium GWA2_55_82]OGQ62942.1 MAG: hypothetical protein A3I81_06460 [Deltaproteobacteria bacterium RIFCSPLOWO2_02_FULL_55_12]OIJ72904.1 MAG: hypothetical protein A2V21_300695 [Deltaproteobacteria bacterium GWC2_55_46]HBG46188.1 hypothetical protein [Deltaproteobacteria bacterium]HCY11686.1 hypothetical protein [Deltaproteobacteria bacterium]